MKKIFMSVDIEGVCGVTDWDETEKNKSDYEEFREQMTREVAAACEGALQAGATEIVVRDAHDSARNIIAANLPEQVRLIRGWSGHPYCMMHGLDSSFDAAIMLGYHAGGGHAGNPLSHTMTNSCATSISINGLRVTEFYINALVASLEAVPVVFVSGDKAICDEARSQISGVGTCSTKGGIGGSTISIHPQKACHDIRQGVMNVLLTGSNCPSIEIPEKLSVEIGFITPALAYKNSFYPGAKLGDNNVVFFETDKLWEMLCFFQFVL